MLGRILLAIAISGFFGSAFAEKRVALVIGNSAYRHSAQLPNPKNDAADVATMLRALGFETIAETDLDKRGMDDAFRRFARLARDADAALFFYAGHGMQFGGVNYLMPIDAQLRDEADLPYEMSKVDDVVADLARTKNIRIVMLDACRDNPLADRLRSALPINRSATIGRGLARIEKSQGMITAFATQAGRVAADGVAGSRNSPFTTAFLRHVATPGIEVGTLFRRVAADVNQTTKGDQLPELSISLLGEFYFVGDQKPQIALGPPPGPLPPPVPPVVPAVGALPPTPASKTTVLSAEQERGLKPKDTFRECDACPEMVVVPAGPFTMGSPEGEVGRDNDEGPLHMVTFARPFAVGQFAVTFAEWDACVAEGGCNGYGPSDQGWGRGRQPVINVSWDDAQAYVAWLSKKTGKTYRLLSESEREYVTRAGTQTPFWWGVTISPQQANYDGNYAYNNGPRGVHRNLTVAVDTFRPNPWGLFQVHGNVWEWTADCYVDSYRAAPNNGTAHSVANCRRRVVRGGSWASGPRSLRAALRDNRAPELRDIVLGFRIGRTIESQ